MLINFQKVYNLTYKQWDISVFNNGLPDFPFEWQISNPFSGDGFHLNDPTSRSNIDGTVTEAKRVVDHYIAHPEDWAKSKRQRTRPQP